MQLRRPALTLLLVVVLLMMPGMAAQAQGKPEPGGPEATASPESPAYPQEEGPEGLGTPSPAPSPESARRPSSPAPPLPRPTQAPPDALEERPGGKAVRVHGREAFRLYLSTRALPLAMRVANVERRLDHLLDRDDLNLDGLKTLEDPKTLSTMVLYQDRLLFAIMPQDTPIEGMAPSLYALRYVEVIRAMYLEAAAQRARALREKAVTVGLEGLVAFPLCLLLCVLLLRLVEGRVCALEGRVIKPLKIHNAVLLDSKALISAFIMVIRFIVFIMLAIACSLYLDYFLSFLADTAELRRMLLAKPVELLKAIGTSVLRYLPNLLFLGFCAFLVRFLLGLNATIFEAMESGAIEVNPSYRDFLAIYHKLARVVIIFFGLVLMLPNLPGYDLPIFKGLSIFAGLVISIGSVGALSNAFAGISLLLSRGLKEGDRIKVGEHVGDVLEMSFATTRIRTISKQDVILPNSFLLQNGVLNMTSPVKEAGSTIFFIAVTIGYNAPGEVVEALFCRAGLATEGVLADPPPFVLQHSLDDFYVTYHLGVHTRVPEQALRLVSDLNRNIRKFFDEAGVEIMSPHYSSLRDGNRVTIPDCYLSTSYEAPAFRLDASVKPPPQGKATSP